MMGLSIYLIGVFVNLLLFAGVLWATKRNVTRSFYVKVWVLVACSWFAIAGMIMTAFVAWIESKMTRKEEEDGEE